MSAPLLATSPARRPDAAWPRGSLLAWALTLLLPPLVFRLTMAHLAAPAPLLLALMVGAALQWGFRAAPDFVVGLVLLWLCALLQIAPLSLVFGGLVSPPFLLVLGMFLLSALLADSPWMVRRCESLLRRTRHCCAWRLATLTCAGALLTLALPSPLGRAALLSPLLRPLDGERDARHHTAVVFALEQGTTLWSTVFLTGNPLNLVLLELLGVQAQRHFQWWGWCQAAVGFALVVTAGLAALLAWLVRGTGRRATPQEDGPPPVEVEGPAMLPPTTKDRVVPALYLLLFAAVLTSPLHGVELHLVIGALALVGCYLVPVSTTTLRTRLDWPTLLFIASVASWQPLLEHVGISAWLEEHLPALALGWRSSGTPLQPLAGVALLAGLMGMVRLVVPSAPAFIVLTTSLLPLARELGLSAWAVGFVLLTTAEGFLWAHQHGVPSLLEAEAQARGLVVEPRRLAVARQAAWWLRVLALLASVPWWQRAALI